VIAACGEFFMSLFESQQMNYVSTTVFHGEAIIGYYGIGIRLYEATEGTFQLLRVALISKDDWLVLDRMKDYFLMRILKFVAVMVIVMMVRSKITDMS
jgi:hypothetical protein